MKNKLCKLVVMALLVGMALLSTLQFAANAEASADADVLLCTRTGLPCDDDGDCGRLNPTCFCAIVAGRGVCGEDFAPAN